MCIEPIKLIANKKQKPTRPVKTVKIDLIKTRTWPRYNDIVCVGKQIYKNTKISDFPFHSHHQKQANNDRETFKLYR